MLTMATMILYSFMIEAEKYIHYSDTKVKPFYKHIIGFGRISLTAPRAPTDLNIFRNNPIFTFYFDTMGEFLYSVPCICNSVLFLSMNFLERTEI